MDIPLSVILGVGSGLVTAIVFIFRLLTAAQDRRLEAAEKRNQTTMEHHEAFVRKAEEERKASAQDRERYIAQLEKLVTTIAAERNVLQEQMIRTVASNTEALNCNTRAREAATVEVEQLMKEVAGVVIIKLVDLGVLPIPGRIPLSSGVSVPEPSHPKAAASK
ncbi:MAG: hypothetical protein QOE70_4670 [Chthoniobacter sp.]|jgi:ATPase subunit of ABC transporter with duplicated ATPase domains|nr:hypothetical protein [Chthoniobacter sp.]